MKYKIYKLLKDGIPVYVGRTEKKHLYDRASDHKYRNKDFDTIELIELTEDPTRETYWIKYYDTYNNGLNKSEDGEGPLGYNSSSWQKRPIKVYNDEGFEKEYESIIEAVRQLGLDHANLTKVCQGKYKQHKGYKAEYIMEVI